MKNLGVKEITITLEKSVIGPISVSTFADSLNNLCWKSDEIGQLFGYKKNGKGLKDSILNIWSDLFDNVDDYLLQDDTMFLYRRAVEKVCMTRTTHGAQVRKAILEIINIEKNKKNEPADPSSIVDKLFSKQPIKSEDNKETKLEAKKQIVDSVDSVDSTVKVPATKQEGHISCFWISNKLNEESNISINEYGIWRLAKDCKMFSHNTTWAKNNLQFEEPRWTKEEAAHLFMVARKLSKAEIDKYSSTYRNRKYIDMTLSKDVITKELNKS